ncbi:MAG: class I SAM-dependent methyltransferase [Candidatus Sericytochromatia bacterium]
MRNYNKEYQDNERKYAYNFDYIMYNYKFQTYKNFINIQEPSLLELGCYQGNFTKLLSEKFNNITVVEASDELIKDAKKNVGEKVNFINSTFEKVDLQSKYDYIFLSHTLEHLDNPTFVLNKIKTWLNNNGILFIDTPNANAPSRQIAVKMGLISHNQAVTPAEKDHGHRKTYSLDTLEKEALDAGLKVLSRGGICFKPMANFQIDKALDLGVISKEYLDACYKLGMIYPDLCSSIYIVCGK